MVVLSDEHADRVVPDPEEEIHIEFFSWQIFEQKSRDFERSDATITLFTKTLRNVLVSPEHAEDKF